MSEVMPPKPAFLFDLDGTLVDNVYQHVLAWRQALESVGIELAVWRIHRRIGMSGGLFVNALFREIGQPINPAEAKRIQKLHGDFFAPLAKDIRPLPGAQELLQTLSEQNVPWAIATSGHMRSASLSIAKLGVDPAQATVITRDMVRHAKPDPDLFLAAAAKLGVDITRSYVIGDSLWDLLAAQRARALGIGLLSGGYGRDELQDASPYRIYNDPADLLAHLDEVGVREAI
jgi:HAD superfamily hydrolase (TIGR01509 family)